VQALQDAFAGFAAELLQLKAEVICKHFEPATIAKMSNAEYLFDAQIVPQAIQLLKQPEMAYVRIVIRPETMAMMDYAKLKSDRIEFLTSLATFMQSAGPLLQTQPNAMPYLLKMLQWTMAGFKGSQEIEGVLDQAIDGAVKEAQNPQQKPDPEQQRGQMELQKIQAKAQADMQLRQQDSQADVQLVQASSQAKLQEIAASHAAKMEEIAAASAAKIELEAVQLASNIKQVQAAADTELEKDSANTILDVAADRQKVKMQPKEEEPDSET